MSEPGGKGRAGFNPFALYKYFKIRITYYKLQFFLAATFFSVLLYGQSKPLQIGDTVPNIQFTNLINYNSSSAQLSDFKDKLMILDFWATWCGSCYKRFPHLDSLQNQFFNSLTIILVNTVSTLDNSAKINSFFAKRKNINGASFQFQNIIGDSVFNNLFPHILLPHYVWIYNHRFIAATGPEWITASNVRNVLSGIPVHWEIKNDSLQFEKRKRLINK